MTASARVPGRRKSTGTPLPVGRIATEAKKSRTTTGITIVTSTFSPRRAVSRSSIPVWARVAATRGAGRLTARPRPVRRLPADELEVRVLEAPAGGPELDDEPPGGGAPAGQGRDDLGVRRGTLEPVAAAVAVGMDGQSRAGSRRAPVPAPPPRPCRATGPGGSAAAPSPRPATPPASRQRRSGPRPGRRSGRPVARRRSGRGWSSGSRRHRRAGPRRSPGSWHGPPGPSRPSARRGSRPRVDRRARARARVAGARRRTAACSGSAPPRSARPARAARPGHADRRGSWPYWRSVSRGWARGSMPPPWSISPTRARSARPPVAGSTPRTRAVPPSAAPVALDDLDRGRLARAVRSEQRDEFPAADRQRDAVEDGPRPVALDQPVNDDHRVAGRHCAIRAYWRSKSASVSSPIWIERTTPVRSTK